MTITDTETPPPSWYPSTWEASVYADVNELQVETLRRLNEAELDHSALLTKVRHMQLDFNRVVARLHAEAKSREWCSEYDSIVAELDRDNVVLKFPPRRRTGTAEYVVRVEVSYDADDDYPNVQRALLSEVEGIEWEAHFGNAEVQVLNVFAR